jgi:hypothetical protein
MASRVKCGVMCAPPGLCQHRPQPACWPQTWCKGNGKGHKNISKVMKSPAPFQFVAAVPTPSRCTEGPPTEVRWDWPNCANGADQETCDAVCKPGFVPTSGGAPTASCDADTNNWIVTTTADRRDCEAGEWARAWCLGDTRVHISMHVLAALTILTWV